MTRRVPLNREHGFTLIELSISLVLLALMASVLYGSLSLAGMSWDRGEAKAQQTGEMRLTEDFLRRTLTSQHPLGRPAALAGLDPHGRQACEQRRVADAGRGAARRAPGWLSELESCGAALHLTRFSQSRCGAHE